MVVTQFADAVNLVDCKLTITVNCQRRFRRCNVPDERRQPLRYSEVFSVDICHQRTLADDSVALVDNFFFSREKKPKRRHAARIGQARAVEMEFVFSHETFMNSCIISMFGQQWNDVKLAPYFFAQILQWHAIKVSFGVAVNPAIRI